MANIPEQPAAWPPVRLIATTDRVLGGEEGAANQQAIAILQRAQYLLAGVEAVQAALGVAQQRATDALTTAGTAATAATGATTLADTARALAVAAQTAAGTADTKATAAQTMASSADTKATAAQTAANTADTKASTADTKATTAVTAANAAQTAVAAKATRYDLGTVNVVYTASVAIGAGSTWVEANCPGALVGDAIFVSPTAAVTFPYGIGAAQCLATDKIRVCINHPALVLGGGFTIPVKAFALR